jgi:hypothetical protein
MDRSGKHDWLGLFDLNQFELLVDYLIVDALPSPGLNPLEGPTMLNCGKLGLGRRSRLPALERGRGAC